MNSRIWRVGGIAFCLLRSGEHYDNVQCRVGIHCTLSNRLRSLPGLLSRSRGVRNKQAQVENSSSLSVLSVPLFSLFSFIRPPSRTIQISCRFCSWLEKRKIRYLFATEISSNFIMCIYVVSMIYAPSQNREQELCYLTLLIILQSFLNNIFIFFYSISIFFLSFI